MRHPQDLDQRDLEAIVLAFEVSPNALMLLDRELRYAAANREYCRVTATPREQLIGRHIFEVFPNDPDDPDNESARMLRASFERVLETGESDTLPLIRYSTPVERDGERRLETHYWSATHTPVLDSDGDVHFIMQHTTNVTELLEELAGGRPLRDVAPAHAIKLAWRQLPLQKRLFELFEQSPALLCYVTGPDRVVELANEAFADLVGLQDVAAKPLKALIPDLAARLDPAIADVMESGRALRMRAVRATVPSNPRVDLAWLDLTLQPISGTHGVHGILIQGVDITRQRAAEARRRAAEEAKRLTEERLKRVVSASRVGTFEIDLVTNQLTADARFFEISGFDSRPMLGTDLLELLPPEDRSDPERLLTSGAQAGDGALAIEFRTLPKDGGKARWIEARGQAFFDPDGGATRLAGTVTDISDRKAVEAERASLLRKERRARAQAEEASRIKDAFLAAVTHELRTPLQAIIGWAHLLRSDAVPEDRREEGLETIAKSARVQAQIIDDLLDVARGASGKLALEMVPLDPSQAVCAAVDTVRLGADAKDIVIDTDIQDGATVLGDATRIQQMAWNLLSNAIKFTPRGGRVAVSLANRDGSVVLEVADDGEGIEPDMLSKVFEPFQQADREDASKGGLGLGLAIVRSLAEAHGGTLAAHSEGRGTGATFRVTLPATARAPAPGSIGDELANLSGTRVLVVDDERIVRMHVSALLASAGAEVTTAATAEQALELLRTAPPDVLVSDLRMPGQDGYDLIRELRSLQSDQARRTPAIALTASLSPHEIARALRAGYQNHVPKPVNAGELTAALAALVSFSAPGGRVG